MKQPRGLSLFTLVTTLFAIAMDLACSSRGSVSIGGACTLGESCSSGVCVAATLDGHRTGWVDGYCTQDCRDQSCPGGSQCLYLSDGTSLCAADCSLGAPCRSGYVCSPGVAVCVPDCRGGWSCGDGLDCDQASGSCREKTKAPAATGGECTIDQECQQGFCIAETNADEFTGWTAGTCSLTCSQGMCPEGSTCVRLEDGASLCLASCSRDKLCRSGYVCNPALFACLPDCRKGWSCGVRLNCNAATGQCVPPILGGT